MTDHALTEAPSLRSLPLAMRAEAGPVAARGAALPYTLQHGIDPRLLSVPPIMELQRIAGNRAVAGLLQRQPGPGPTGGPGPGPGPTTGPTAGPGATGGPTTGQTGATPTVTATPPDPLADSRIKWIEDLPTTIRLSIDSVGENKLRNRIAKLDASIARQKAAIDKAATKDAKDAATKAMESDADVKAKADLNAAQGKGWATKRIALMDYMGCSLGGDVGVERYYKALVPFGPEDLWVHPEVARRLIRVRDDLKAENVPMPDTSVGFALRGRHIHPAKEDKYPGMMTHSLGVAIDWEAYKNVHFKDEALMALVGAVTGGSHNMNLPAGYLNTIVAMGEASMGKTLTAQQQKDAAGGDKVIETIGSEYDRLAGASDKLRDSLTFDTTKVLELHHTLIDLQKAIPPAAANLAKAKRRRGKDAAEAVKKAQEAFDSATAALPAKLAEVKPQLEELFKPWIKAINDAITATRKEAEPLLGGRPLEEVITDRGLASKEAAVKAATKPAAGDLAKLVKSSTATATATTTLRTKVAAARAYLDEKGTAQEKVDWSARLSDIEARAEKVMTKVGATRSEAQVLSGGAPAAASAAPTAKAKAPSWAKSVGAWEADLVKQEAAADTGEAALTTANTKLTPEAIQSAHTLRDERAASEAIRAKVTKPQFEQLQALKVKLFYLQQASDRLLNDASFMFKEKDARDPGVAQITGVLGLDPKARADLGGGGFFGTSTAGLEATKKGKPTSRSGFGKQFFQVMARYGFEPAATWHTADTMHFQVQGLVDQIMPVDACLEPPADAESKAKNDKEQAAIDAARAKSAAARTKAAAARTAGEAFSTGAAAAHTTWEKEGGKH